MNYRFRPSLGSFLESAGFDAAPAIIAVVFRWLLGSHLKVVTWIGLALGLLMSFFSFVTTVLAHLSPLEISPDGIRRFYVVSGERAMRWSDITDATLRERHNPVSRTDRLLILKAQRSMLVYPLSVLSRADELKVLEELNRHTRLVVVQDRPAI